MAARQKVTVALCTLNQWAMDFEGNYQRIIQSIEEAKLRGAKYRVGPELEICGYGCYDHYHEGDTVLHCFEVLLKLMNNPITSDIICDVGMPVNHRNSVYNCRAVFLNRKILLFRAKMSLAGAHNYREPRYFRAWDKIGEVEEFFLPSYISNATGQHTAPIGDAQIVTKETCIGYEMCEELWKIDSTHIQQCLTGAEIIFNSSASHYKSSKKSTRESLVQTASSKIGGLYCYTNNVGCDGDRLIFDGHSFVFLNGELIAEDEFFSFSEVNVMTVTVDLADIRTYRSNNVSFSSNCSNKYKCHKIRIDFTMCAANSLILPVSIPIQSTQWRLSEEIRMAAALWLWDYLRRSGQGGFFLPLSGGMDSSSVAVIVYSMCVRVCEALESGYEKILKDVQRIVCDDSFIPSNPKELCNKLLVTCYMGSSNSSKETKQCAESLAKDINSTHLNVCIDLAVDAVVKIFTMVSGKSPRYKVHGGSHVENLALQNIQARLRMVLSYTFGQLTLWTQGRPGSLLVLASANVDEGLSGYMTKYDCSSGDINPIGGISKTDLRLFLQYCQEYYNLPILDSILNAPPSAELVPLSNGVLVQTDEQEMGMTYEELSMYGQLRKVYGCGPYSMFCKLLVTWRDKLSPVKIAENVKHFFRLYSINRHKMTTLTPSMHVVDYSPDDNRFDMRQFLYNVQWPWQFRCIDEQVANLQGSS